MRRTLTDVSVVLKFSVCCVCVTDEQQHLQSHDSRLQRRGDRTGNRKSHQLRSGTPEHDVSCTWVCLTTHRESAWFAVVCI